MKTSTFIKGTLILTIATLLSKVLGSIFRIPLQNIAGDEVLGIFSLVYPVYMVALTLSVAGIPVAISKLIAEARSHNKLFEVEDIRRTAGILALLFGLTSFTFIYLFSSPIANALGGQDTRYALIVVAGTLLISPYMAVYRGYFQGFEDMRPTAISQVIEQLVRVLLILSMAYLLVRNGYSNDIVSGGIMIGSIVGAFISLVYLRVRYNRFEIGSNFRQSSYSLDSFRKWSRRILIISLPIAMGAVTMPLLQFVDSFTVTFGLKSTGYDSGDISYMYGLYGRGLALIQIATVFSSSIVLPLIPLLTKKLSEKKLSETRGVIEKSHNITHFISWPATFGLVGLTIPLNLALFTDLQGSWTLGILLLSSIFTSLTVLGIGILQGMNRAKHAATLILAGLILKVILNVLLVQKYGIMGAAISTLLIYLFLFIVNTIMIHRAQSFVIFQKETFLYIVVSLLMGLLVGLPTLSFSISEWTRLAALGYVGGAMIFGALFYFVVLYKLKAIDSQWLKELPIVRKLQK